MKVVVIAATFPELRPQHRNQQGRGSGSTIRSAFAAAARDLLKEPRLKRKRITTFTASCSVGTAPDQE